MDRRTFFGSVGSAGVVGLLPPSVLGRDCLPPYPRIPSVFHPHPAVPSALIEWTARHWWQEFTFSLEVSEQEGTYEEIVKSGIFPTFLKSEVTWYRWPQDRPLILESPHRNPRFEGDVGTIYVPSFDIRSIDKVGADIWDEIVSALRWAAVRDKSEKYCAVFEIEGLKEEFGICTCDHPMQPVINHWKNRDQLTDYLLAIRKTELVRRKERAAIPSPVIDGRVDRTVCRLGPKELKILDKSTWW